MKRCLVLLAVIVVMPIVASAQDYPKAEVYGTYSLFVADIDALDNESLHGWGIGVQGNLNKWFGVVGEYSAHHGASGPLSFQTPGAIIIIPEVDLRVRTYLFGPRLSFRSKPVTVFGHYLVGGGHLKVEDEATGLTAGNNEFAMAVGGGVDVNLGKRFAIRAAQFDYLSIHTDINERIDGSSSSWAHNTRFQAGFVFKFGN
jgi:opacity protein-like surface antigen